MQSKSKRLFIAKVMGWTLVPALLLVGWEFAAREAANPFLFPRMVSVMKHLAHPFKDQLKQGSLAFNTLVSLMRVACGFSVAAFAGILFGILLGSGRFFRALFEPLLEVFRPLCPIAWIPFAIAVFGRRTILEFFGVQRTGWVIDHVQQGMLFVLFWGAFFPVLVNTLDGVAGVRNNYLRLARTLGAGRWQTFRHVYLPAATPMILTGLRQGIGTCWFVIIAAEMLPGAASGIGYLLMHAADETGSMDVVIAAMIIIGFIGAGLNFSMVFVMKRFVRWYGKEN